jgi:hypothetical protein
MSSVALIGIGKSFGRRSALEVINLGIADGEFMVVVGPSGCGKSTLLSVSSPAWVLQADTHIPRARAAGRGGRHRAASAARLSYRSEPGAARARGNARPLNRAVETSSRSWSNEVKTTPLRQVSGEANQLREPYGSPVDRASSNEAAKHPSGPVCSRKQLHGALKLRILPPGILQRHRHLYRRCHTLSF